MTMAATCILNYVIIEILIKKKLKLIPKKVCEKNLYFIALQLASIEACASYFRIEILALIGYSALLMTPVYNLYNVQYWCVY